MEEENQEKANEKSYQNSSSNLKEYVTECPLYETESVNPLVTPVNSSSNQQKYIYTLNLNNYDKGRKPYYPSMDPNAMGGELKYKSKKKIKAIEKEKKKETNNFGKLLQIYEDLDT